MPRSGYASLMLERGHYEVIRKFGESLPYEAKPSKVIAVLAKSDTCLSGYDDSPEFRGAIWFTDWLSRFLGRKAKWVTVKEEVRDGLLKKATQIPGEKSTHYRVGLWLIGALELQNPGRVVAWMLSHPLYATFVREDGPKRVELTFERSSDGLRRLTRIDMLGFEADACKDAWVEIVREWRKKGIEFQVKQFIPWRGSPASH